MFFKKSAIIGCLLTVLPYNASQDSFPNEKKRKRAPSNVVTLRKEQPSTQNYLAPEEDDETEEDVEATEEFVQRLGITNEQLVKMTKKLESDITTVRRCKLSPKPAVLSTLCIVVGLTTAKNVRECYGVAYNTIKSSTKRVRSVLQKELDLIVQEYKKKEEGPIIKDRLQGFGVEDYDFTKMVESLKEVINPNKKLSVNMQVCLTLERLANETSYKQLAQGYNLKSHHTAVNVVKNIEPFLKKNFPKILEQFEKKK